MASQQVKMSQETATQAHRPRPQHIDTSGRLLSQNPRDGVRTQPQLLNGHEIDAMNKKLLAAGQAIEATRQKLYETRFIADTALQELEQERHIRQQCSDAYKEAHVQYGKKVGEVHDMANKCMSLHKELEKSQETISNYQSTFENLENSIASGKVQLEESAKEVERKTSELQIAMTRIQGLEKEVNKAVAKECLTKKRVNELEEEKAHLNLALQRVDGLEEERGQLGLALQKIHNLEQERKDAAEKYQARINEMIAREALAEQRIAEQRQEIDELMQELQVVTMGRLNSPGGKPGTRGAANPAHGRPSKYRKCKDVRKAGEEDANGRDIS